MKIERTFVGKDSFLTLFMPFIEAGIDRTIERQEDIKYNEGNANHLIVKRWRNYEMCSIYPCFDR